MDIYSVIFITLVAAFIASLSQFLYKTGVKKGSLNSLHEIIMLFKTRNVALGLLGYALGVAVYLYALKQADLSIVYPAFSSTFIFITLISKFFLKEEIGIMRAMGVVAIIIGISIIALSFGG